MNMPGYLLNRVTVSKWQENVKKTTWHVHALEQELFHWYAYQGFPIDLCTGPTNGASISHNVDSTMPANVTWLEWCRCLGGVQYCLNTSQVDLKNHRPCFMFILHAVSHSFYLNGYDCFKECSANYSVWWYWSDKAILSQGKTVMHGRIRIYNLCWWLKQAPVKKAFNNSPSARDWMLSAPSSVHSCVNHLHSYIFLYSHIIG